MKKLFLITFAFCTLAINAVARDAFAIVIDKQSYNQAKTEVDAYAQTIEQMHNLKVITVIDRWGIPDSIRAELIRLHSQKQEPVIGTVLIGDIPIAMIRDGQHMTSAFKMDQTQPRKESSIPSDRFYDDFGLRFTSQGHDTDAPYYYYSVTSTSAQRLHPDIYSGRIRPTDANGISRYQKLRDYLRKLVIEKRKNRSLNQLFYFSGHGYISESKVARIDEKAAWFEHFPQLKNRTNNISYMDHSDHYPVKTNLMNEVMRTDLDLAVLHHHGYWNTEYLNGQIPINTVNQAKDFIRKMCREHIVEAKQKGRDYAKMQEDFMKRFDLPKTWFDDVFDAKLNAQDSIEDANEDLHIEDFKEYGYKPNAPIVMIDACFCGSFHREDCIADEYIFQPGHTVAVIANSVNVLQDKWSDRLIGLIADGGCVGDIVRFSTFLESHVIGDPTFRFAASKDNTVDVDHLINEKNPSKWRKLLNNKLPELQSLAIEELCNLGNMKSAELKKIYETSPYGTVRLMALVKITDFRDNNFIETVKLASQDAYELVQRQAIRLIHNSGDERLIPSLIKICISNNTSDRVNFDAMSALSVYPKDKLLAEFTKQFDDPSVCYIHKDSVRNQIKNAIEHNADYLLKDVQSLNDTTLKVKTQKSNIRAMRNNLVHFMVPTLFKYIEKDTTTPDLQLLVIEALGWHPTSYMAPQIAEGTLKISKDPKYTQAVQNEALKTYNRINAK